MDQQMADHIREDYVEGVSVVDISIETGQTRATIYKVLNNQICPDKKYVKPYRPKDIIEEFGKERLLKMVDKRTPQAEMKRVVEEATGKEISEAAVAWWATELKIARGIASGEGEVLILSAKEWMKREKLKGIKCKAKQ